MNNADHLNLIKKLMLYIVLVLVLINLGCSAQNGENSSSSSPTYTIKGNIQGLEEGWVSLLKAGEYLGYTFETIDSATITNGRFEFNGEMKYSEMFYLQLPKEQPISFFATNDHIYIEGNLEKLDSLVITGSALHTELDIVENKLEKIALDKNKWNFIENYIKKDSSSELGPFLILTHIYNLATYAELKSIHSLLDDSLSNHRYTQRIKNQLNTLEAVLTGKISPNIVLKDTSGNEVSIENFRGNYILLDFWASWCAPCRKENPAMISLYQELRSDNIPFEIIGIAADFEESRWKKAIVQDQLPWINISDVKGFDGIALQMYGIKSLPYTVLLDKEGSIMVKGLTGEELRNTIREILYTL